MLQLQLNFWQWLKELLDLQKQNEQYFKSTCTLWIVKVIEGHVLKADRVVYLWLTFIHSFIHYAFSSSPVPCSFLSMSMSVCTFLRSTASAVQIHGRLSEPDKLPFCARPPPVHWCCYLGHVTATTYGSCHARVVPRDLRSAKSVRWPRSALDYKLTLASTSVVSRRTISAALVICRLHWLAVAALWFNPTVSWPTDPLYWIRLSGERPDSVWST